MKQKDLEKIIVGGDNIVITVKDNNIYVSSDVKDHYLIYSILIAAADKVKEDLKKDFENMDDKELDELLDAINNKTLAKGSGTLQ